MEKMIFKKKLSMIFIIVLVLFLLPIVFSAYYQYNNRLFLFEAKILWGEAPFNSIEFQKGSIEIRASMVVDLIKSRRYIGEKCSIIPEFLGPKTGDYYHSDSNSTYKLTEKKTTNWVLTFICGESGEIEKIIIRKSCCSISKKILYWGTEIIHFLL